jgi:ABC-2 type transport system permease protein
MAFGAFNGIRQVAEKRSAGASILQKQEEKFAKMKAEADSVSRDLKKTEQWWTDPTSPMVAGEFQGGRMLVAEPASISALATGMSDLQAEAELLQVRQSYPRSSSDFENPVNLTLGSFDLAFVLVFLLPLFVIALTFNLVSAEREQGTLALLLSQPVAARRLFTLKMLARFGLLAGLVLLLLLPLMAWMGVSPTRPELWQTAGAVALYAFFWFVLSLTINLLNQSSAFNALACAGVWLMLVVVVPALVNMAAEKARPLPTRAGYLNALRDADRLATAKKDSVLTALYTSRSDLTRKPDEEKTMREHWLERFALVDFRNLLRDGISAGYDAKMKRQAELSRSLMSLSPALALQHRLVEIAGTGTDALNGNRQAIRAQQQAWEQFFRKKIETDEKVLPADYEAIQQMPSRLAAQAAAQSGKGAFWLAFQCLLAAGLAWLIGRRKTPLTN